ncbi:hypothetical protein U1Q18_029502 [Sarracenia purpurea var. burkii]
MVLRKKKRFELKVDLENDRKLQGNDRLQIGIFGERRGEEDGGEKAEAEEDWTGLKRQWPTGEDGSGGSRLLQRFCNKTGRLRPGPNWTEARRTNGGFFFSVARLWRDVGK